MESHPGAQKAAGFPAREAAEEKKRHNSTGHRCVDKLHAVRSPKLLTVT